MSPTPVRLIVDAPATGAVNMARDEVLLRSAALEGTPTLRFYRWSEPTLSLGYFQPWQQRFEHPPSRVCAAVRRASGGGAIVHDEELTYSFATRTDARWAAEDLYVDFHQTLVDCLQVFGIQCELRPPIRDRSGPEPFLCFQRRAAGGRCAEELQGDRKRAAEVPTGHFATRQRAVASFRACARTARACNTYEGGRRVARAACRLAGSTPSSAGDRLILQVLPGR